MKPIDNSEALLHKYNSGQCTTEEKALVETWFLTWKEEGTAPTKKQTEQVVRDLLSTLPQPLIQQAVSRRTNFRFNWPLRIAIATAAILILLSTWTLLFVDTPVSKTYSNDIDPGSNKATLILANGQTINLSNAKTGVVIDASELTYNDGTVIGSLSSRANTKEPDPSGLGMTSVTTPAGGTYQITLPDGSKAWLNAASSLKFPAKFDQRKRIVTLTGEAYFEISKDKKHPFIVKTNHQEVTVLGTHFNINSYADEKATKTTLLEGSVKVATQGKVVLLKPNQQSLNAGSALIIKQIDPNTVIAWKNGEFAFSNEPLESIMRNIARWYNVTVSYENPEARNIPFGGSISRFGKVSEVLCMLELTGKVKFKIEGRRITVI
ncbi:hypothetical protein HDC92_001810 [Pedobacter sp. AK017]|uniref:FecR family protein n=1 Tax=Pedobacter sp. AK017 TaxID=2723073 RepID=UPI001621B33F|nr:FecR family protein [Pedobacter sp. AK017]MBB5438135.1 hypothetical protein [Pedobacter sp. AK017]